MAAALAMPSLQTIFDEVGRFIPGAKVYYFLAGTTTPLIVYTTADLDVPHARPVLANAAGRFPPIYVGEVSYKARILDASGTLLEEIDGIQGAVPVPAEPGEVIPGTTIPTGFMLPAYATEPAVGWVRANARTIGSAASGASELADATANELFLHLWNIDATLEISGGRGVSAAADWTANKTLTLPDFRGRSIRGLDGMGNSLAGIITTETFTDPNLLGSVGGLELVNLSIDNIDEVTLTGAASSAGIHNHASGITDAQGSHTHTYDDVEAPNHLSFGVAGGAGVNDFILYPQVSNTKSTNSSGLHQHNVTMADSGSHTHDITIDPVGGGEAHNNMSPTMLVTVYIKL